MVTPRFTIVGRIVNPAIKAKSEYFGDVEHSLVKLRHVRVLVETRDTEVVIDAAKYGQPNQWLDTGITVESAGTLAVMASGEVELRPSMPGTYLSSPRGFTRVAAAGGGFGGKGGKKLGGDPPWRKALSRNSRGPHRSQRRHLRHRRALPRSGSRPRREALSANRAEHL